MGVLLNSFRPGTFSYGFRSNTQQDIRSCAGDFVCAVEEKNPRILFGFETLCLHRASILRIIETADQLLYCRKIMKDFECGFSHKTNIHKMFMASLFFWGV